MLARNGLKEEVYSFLFAGEALRTLPNNVDEEGSNVILLDLNLPVMNGWDFLDKWSLLWPQICGKCRFYIFTSSLDPLDR